MDSKYEEKNTHADIYGRGEPYIESMLALRTLNFRSPLFVFLDSLRARITTCKRTAFHLRGACGTNALEATPANTHGFDILMLVTAY